MSGATVGATTYGVGEVEGALRRAGKGYVLGRGHRRPSIPVPGRGPGGRHGGSDRTGAAGLGLGAPVGRLGAPLGRLGAPLGRRGHQKGARRLYDWAYIWGWRSSRPRPRATRAAMAYGRAACSSDPASPTSSLRPSSPPGARPAPRSGRWSASRAGAGRSRPPSRPPRTRARPRPQRDPQPAWLAPPCLLVGHARPRPAGGDPPPGQRHHATPEERPGRAKPPLVRWSSVQEIRRLACRLARRRIEPAFAIAWSSWRRCHRAVAQQAHLTRTVQL
jgi:hypothetical protein